MSNEAYAGSVRVSFSDCSILHVEASRTFVNNVNPINLNSLTTITSVAVGMGQEVATSGSSWCGFLTFFAFLLTSTCAGQTVVMTLDTALVGVIEPSVDTSGTVFNKRSVTGGTRFLKSSRIFLGTLGTDTAPIICVGGGIGDSAIFPESYCTVLIWFSVITVTSVAYSLTLSGLVCSSINTIYQDFGIQIEVFITLSTFSRSGISRISDGTRGYCTIVSNSLCMC